MMAPSPLLVPTPPHCQSLELPLPIAWSTCALTRLCHFSFYQRCVHETLCTKSSGSGMKETLERGGLDLPMD